MNQSQREIERGGGGREEDEGAEVSPTLLPRMLALGDVNVREKMITYWVVGGIHSHRHCRETDEHTERQRQRAATRKTDIQTERDRDKEIKGY